MNEDRDVKGEKDEHPKAKEASHDPSQNTKKETQAVTLSNQEYQDLLVRLNGLEALRERLLRSAADYENSKKRLIKEREEFVKFSQENLLRRLLPVLDNLERALAHLQDSSGTNFKNTAAGIQMVLKQLAEVLKNQGLNRFKAVGETFDPHRHEAVGFVHGQGKEDEVVEEIEPGYMLHDRLLRAAKVRVRARASNSSSSQRPSSETPEQEKSEEIT